MGRRMLIRAGVVIATMAFLLLPAQLCSAEDDWVAGAHGITGLSDSDLTRTDADSAYAGRHYDGPGGAPETATFSIDTEGVTDIDCRELTPGEWETQDAGVAGSLTVWKAKGSTTLMSQGALTSTFTPGSALLDDIDIQAIVKDGLQYSRACDNPDPDVTLTYQGAHLRVFKVAVLYGDSVEEVCYEDSDGSKLMKTDLGSLAALESSYDTTELPPGGSAWDGGDITPGVRKYESHPEWTALAVTDGGAQLDGTQMKRSIRFKPKIVCSGALCLKSANNGVWWPGSDDLDIVYDNVPYGSNVERIVNVLSFAMTSAFVHGCGFIGGASTLYGVANGVKEADMVVMEDETGLDEETTTFGCLSQTAPTDFKLKSKSTTGGSVNMKAQCGGHDDSGARYAAGEVYIPDGNDGAVEYGIDSQPTYGD